MVMEIVDVSHQTLAQEYQFLCSLNKQNPAQEDRFAHILDLALSDPILDEIIQQIELGSISDDDMQVILDQQAKMREYLGTGTVSPELTYANTRA